jgi:predicted DCC family thiol-disulfide oxidoreductase YuxK
MTPASDARPLPVLLFDGECGLCNRIVRLMLRLDVEGRLRFAPLQGEPAQAYLRVHGLPTEDFDSIVFVPDWGAMAARPAFRTAGAIEALRAIGGAGRLLGDLLALFPGWLRDAGYRGIARCRYRIFGPWRPRPLPRSEWAARFL